MSRNTEHVGIMNDVDMVRGATEGQARGKRGGKGGRGRWGGAKLQTGWCSGHRRRRWVATEAWGSWGLRTPFV